MKYLAFDFGASSGRAILGILENGVLKTEEIHRFSNDPVDIHKTLYWDIMRLFFEIKVGINKCVNAGHADIASIGIDTWGVDIGFLDEDGRLICNPLHYRDGITDGVFDKVFAEVPAEEIYEKTGIQFMKFNTLFQLYAMKKSGFKPLDMAKSFLFTPDLLNYFLTGKKCAEYSIASTAQMLDAKKRDWDYPLLERLNIDKELLSNIVSPGTVIGTITPEISAELGCGQIPVVAVASHDTASAVVSVPSDKQSFAYISCGTWSLLGVEEDEPVINEATFDASFTNEGGAEGKIRLLKNIMGLWLVQECKRHWDKRGKNKSYAELEDMARKAEPFAAFIDPDYDDFMAPGNMPRKIATFCEKTGQKPPADQGETVRCIAESLAFKYRYSIEKLEEITERNIDVIHMVGGGIKDKMLCQFTANATGRKVVAGPVEATAIGNLMIQAKAAGEVENLSSIRKIIKNSEKLTEYLPQDVDLWNQYYPEFKEVLKG